MFEKTWRRVNLFLGFLPTMPIWISRSIYLVCKIRTLTHRWSFSLHFYRNNMSMGSSLSSNWNGRKIYLKRACLHGFCLDSKSYCISSVKFNSYCRNCKSNCYDWWRTRPIQWIWINHIDNSCACCNLFSTRRSSFN